MEDDDGRKTAGKALERMGTRFTDLMNSLDKKLYYWIVPKGSSYPVARLSLTALFFQYIRWEIMAYTYPSLKDIEAHSKTPSVAIRLGITWTFVVSLGFHGGLVAFREGCVHSSKETLPPTTTSAGQQVETGANNAAEADNNAARIVTSHVPFNGVFWWECAAVSGLFFSYTTAYALFVGWEDVDDQDRNTYPINILSFLYLYVVAAPRIARSMDCNEDMQRVLRRVYFLRVVVAAIAVTSIPLTLAPLWINMMGTRDVALLVYPLMVSMGEAVMIRSVDDDVYELFGDWSIAIALRPVYATLAAARVSLVVVVTNFSGDRGALVRAVFNMVIVDALDMNNAFGHCITACINGLKWMRRGGTAGYLRYDKPLPRSHSVLLSVKPELSIWPTCYLLLIKLSGFALYHSVTDTETNEVNPLITCDWDVLAIVATGPVLGYVLGVCLRSLLAKKAPHLVVQIPNSKIYIPESFFSNYCWLFVIFGNSLIGLMGMVGPVEKVLRDKEG